MTDFDRYAPAISAFFMGSCMVPIIFGAVVLHGGSPVTPQQYGEVVYAVPAVVWAAVQFGASGLTALSAAARWPRMTAIGSGIMCIYLTFLAAAAAMAGATGTLVMAACGFWLGPIAGLAAYVAWQGRHDG